MVLYIETPRYEFAIVVKLKRWGNVYNTLPRVVYIKDYLKRICFVNNQVI